MPPLPDVLTATPDSLTPRWRDRLAQLHLSPEQLLFPQTVEELGAIARHCYTHGQTYRPCGAGTKLPWGREGAPLNYLVSMAALNGIIDHAVGDLTITVAAGATLATVQSHLAASDQFLPLDPSYPQTATLGGIVATGDAGSWRQRYGGVRDLLLGIGFVRADGTAAKAGGRVVKNVAGYDLMKLLTGSFGTLATITELTFRTYPRPAMGTTQIYTGSLAAITAASGPLLKIAPVRWDLCNRELLRQWDLGGELGMILEFAGMPATVKMQQDQGGAIAQQAGLKVTSPGNHLWARVGDQLRPGDGAMMGRFGVSPAALGEILTTVPPGIVALGHRQSGLGQFCYTRSPRLDELRRFRRRCEQNQGFLTLLTAPPEIKAQFEPWGYPGNAVGLMRAVKAQFDPQNLLSPGCFVGGI
ncbi:FAD-binding oxidoreductase [Spirulina sp. CCNP1310]|uniref:FAD-binding oxidoreductase n=1 Tax=Spirulina sp. CCNP1310 TaxID=3110249 RepID=UPI002B1F015C|nr:FAD-binding oxidoreductase [Spirulina sp. CCNP1310]MEA5418488.1 FAD-binding oxidoreductase [Spirulina sp. CCNP1310]